MFNKHIDLSSTCLCQGGLRTGESLADGEDAWAGICIAMFLLASPTDDGVYIKAKANPPGLSCCLWAT